MKNIILFVLGLIIGALAMYFYCCSDENLEIEQPVSKPKGLITPKEIGTLDQAYNARHRLISDSLIRTSDNRSSWYAIGDIESYIIYARKQADSLGYKLDGLRVYAGAYPDDNGAGLMTMFFVPTGVRNEAKGSFFPNLQSNGGKDIVGGDGLDLGQGGDPPGANYPQ